MSLPTNPTLKKTPSSSTGATDSPYLGSKISLVSKAKIRYEGILYTIDANESTVALSKVRSFGTEDRPTDRPVHARDEIFEYIIFRGADIEDLQVREPPQSSFTHDPAIVESSMYPANARSNTVGNNLGGSSQTGQTRSSSNQGTMPSPPIQQGSNSKGHKLSSNADPLRQLNINQQQSSSRPYSQQSPAVQLDGQDFSYGGGGGGGQRRGPRQQRQDYYDDFNGNSRRNNQNYGYAEWPRVGNGGTGWDNNNWGNGYRQQQQQQQQQQRYSRPQPNFYPQRRFNNGQQANGYYGNDRGYGYRQRRNSTGGITGNDGQDGNQQQQQQQRGNRQHQQQHQQQQQQQQQQQRERANSTRGNGNNSRTALKFIGDFDFEKSNAEFDKNAIEDEIKKSLSIKTTKGETTSDETPKSPSKTDASTPGTQQEKENQQSQQQQQQQQQQQPISSSSQSEQELNPDGYYDKQKSFFDRISCEATEKERTNARRNWNEERRMNAETFGLKYRPVQQGGNQRGSQGGYYNNNRRNNNINGGGQQMYYGNGGRYPRGGGYGGQQQQQQQQQRGRGNGQGYGRNTMYYGNPNNRMRAY